MRMVDIKRRRERWEGLEKEDRVEKRKKSVNLKKIGKNEIRRLEGK